MFFAENHLRFQWDLNSCEHTTRGITVKRLIHSAMVVIGSLGLHLDVAMLIYFCDNFLQWYEIQMFGLVFERLFQAQNEMISSTEYQTKFTKLQVNLKNYLKKIFL